MRSRREMNEKEYLAILMKFFPTVCIFYIRILSDKGRHDERITVINIPIRGNVLAFSFPS